MRKIEAIIRSKKLDQVQAELRSMGIGGMSVANIRGFGNQRTPGRDFDEKIKIEIYVDEFQADKVVELIIRTAKTGKVGDGKVIISPIDNIYRIRTGESGPKAV